MNPFTLVIVLLGIVLHCSMGAPSHSRSIEHDPDFTLGFSFEGQVFKTMAIQDGTYGLRNVTYFTTDDGQAVIDGDVVYGAEDDLLAAALMAGQGLTSITKAFSKRNQPWRDATVKYKYASDEVERLLFPTLDRAIQRWKAVAPYLTFKRIIPNSIYQDNDILQVTAECTGCRCHMGYTPGQAHGLNLAPSLCGGLCDIKQAVHELGHALGLHHEHQRPDREQYIRVLCVNVAPACSNMPADKTCCDWPNLPGPCCAGMGDLVPVSVDRFDSSGPYDFNSIMHYGAGAFGKGGKLTMISRIPGLEVPLYLREYPSERDIKRVCKIYSDECKGGY